jgi:nucleoid DNA-binding protein
MQTKATLAKKLREPGLSYRDASVYLDILLDTIVETLSNGESIQLRGFGTFYVGKRAARNTSISGVVPEHGIVAFRPSDNLRKAVWEKGK